MTVVFSSSTHILKVKMAEKKLWPMFSCVIKIPNRNVVKLDDKDGRRDYF